MIVVGKRRNDPISIYHSSHFPADVRSSGPREILLPRHYHGCRRLMIMREIRVIFARSFTGLGARTRGTSPRRIIICVSDVNVENETIVVSDYGLYETWHGRPSWRKTFKKFVRLGKQRFWSTRRTSFQPCRVNSLELKSTRIMSEYDDKKNYLLNVYDSSLKRVILFVFLFQVILSNKNCCYSNEMKPKRIMLDYRFTIEYFLSILCL